MDLIETEIAAPLELQLHKVARNSHSSTFYISFSPLNSSRGKFVWCMF